MIYAVAIVYDGLDLAPHFLRHYSAIGVDRILLGVEESQCDLIRAVAEGFRVVVVPFKQKRFNDPGVQELEEILIRLQGVEDDEYVLYSDLDEFHEYPAPLGVVIEEMDRRNLWAVRGWFVDRLASDGKFRPILPEPPLDEQFPIRSHVTRNIIGGCDQKIMLCRRRVRLQPGHHDTFNAYYDIAPIPGDYRVHHYKWTAGIGRRMAFRADGIVDSMYERELALTLRIAAGDGGFDLADSRLGRE